DLPFAYSNWRANESLPEFLERGRTVAIAGIDTRKLTRILREKGAQAGCIMTGDNADQAAAVKLARKFPGLKGMDLAKVVSTKRAYQWNEGTLWPETGRAPIRAIQRLHVVAYDFGLKRNILRLLADGGCRMTVVPAQTPAEEVLAREPDGIFLSNGPGDPEPCEYAITAPTTRCRTWSPGASSSPVRTTASRSMSQRSPRASRPRTARCSTARCRGWRLPSARCSASRAILRGAPGRTT